MTKANDKDAIARAVAMMLDQEPDRAEHFKRDPEAASYVAQIRTLNLKPWENPPMYADPDGDKVTDRLLRKMLDAGLSKYEPDPLAALGKG